jgi:hypothetical protein
VVGDPHCVCQQRLVDAPHLLSAITWSCHHDICVGEGAASGVIAGAALRGAC